MKTYFKRLDDAGEITQLAMYEYEAVFTDIHMIRISESEYARELERIMRESQGEGASV